VTQLNFSFCGAALLRQATARHMSGTGIKSGWSWFLLAKEPRRKLRRGQRNSESN
jgi:hypothetical protein